MEQEIQQQNRLQKLFQLILSFIKIGIIGFGGGSAVIPVIEKEVVHDRGLIPSEQYRDYIIVGNITPGGIQIKIAAACGEYVCGTLGMIAAAFAITLPSVIATILIISMISMLGDQFLHYIEYASVGISAFIIFVLIKFMEKVLKDSKKQNFGNASVWIMLSAALLTFGKEIRQFIALVFGDGLIPLKPLLDISTIQLLTLTFFVLFFTGGQFKNARGVIAAGVGLLFLSTFGKTPLITAGFMKPLLYGVMLLGAAWGLVTDLKSQTQTRSVDLKTPLIQSACFAGIIGIALAVVYVFMDAEQGLWYALNGFLSTITSFGGGEAYLTVADGVFVASGFVPANLFYSQLLPVANALPGVILVKLLAGIGYLWGAQVGGVPGGLLASLLGTTLGVGASCIVFVFVFSVYKSFASLPIFEGLKKVILPEVCGLLIPTIISMLNEVLHVTTAVAVPQWGGLLLFAGALVFAYLLHKRTKFVDAAIIALCGLGTTIILSLL